MKKISFLVSIIFLMFSSCNTDELLTFYFTDNAQFTVPSSLGVNVPFDIATPDVSTNSLQEFKNNNTNINLVKDIRLTNLDLTILSPPEKTFKFLKSISLYLKVDGLDEVKIAYADLIPETIGNALSLTMTDAKLLEYLKKEKYSIRTAVVTRETFIQDIEINAKMKFKVTAKGL